MVVRTLKHFNSRHNQSSPVTPEYAAYTNAKNRCANRNNDFFRFYGGRGIKFLFKSFQEFLNHIGKKPSARHVLDRIDNNGHYEPGNVRWTTRSESMSNRRMTKRMLRALLQNLKKARAAPITPKRRRASMRNIKIAQAAPMTVKKLLACLRNVKKAQVTITPKRRRASMRNVKKALAALLLKRSQNSNP